MIRYTLQDKEKINFVIGLGKSGFWAAKFLKSIGKKVIVIENKKNKQLQKCKEELEEIGVQVCLNSPFDYRAISKSMNSIEKIIISPGINLESKTITKLRKLNIEFIGEVNIAWENLKNLNWVHRYKWENNCHAFTKSYAL